MKIKIESLFKESLQTKANQDIKDLNKSIVAQKGKMNLRQLLNHYVVIKRDNKFMPYFKILIMLLSLISSISYSFFAVFRKDVDFNTYEEYQAQNRFNIYYFSQEQVLFNNDVQTWCEMFFLLVLFIRCISEVQDPIKDVSIKDLKQIFMFYV